MAITDRTRRLLWGRSAARCAICRRHLVEDETPASAASIVGEEAHIVARSPGGPRYRDLPINEVDDISNLVLLCRVHHKKVDDQVGDFTVDVLKAIKALHESTMRARTEDGEARFAGHGSVDEPSVLTLVRTGSQLWDIVSGALAFRSAGLEDSQAPKHVVDAVDSFLQVARDWGEISGDVALEGMGAVRRAKRSLHAAVSEMHEFDLKVFGATRCERSGYVAMSEWMVATVAVTLASDDRILLF